MTGEGATSDRTEPPSFEVDADHPEVMVIIEAAVKVAMEQEVTLQPEVWIEVMEEVIKETEHDLRQQNPDGPMSVCW